MSIPASIFFLSPLTFVVFPLFVFPTWQAALCCLTSLAVSSSMWILCLLRLISLFLPLHSFYFLSSLALSTSCYLSPSLTPSLNLSLSLSVFLRSLSLSLSLSLPVLSLFPPSLLSSHDLSHAHTSFSHSDAHIVTLLQCLIFSLLHGLPFPAH